MPVDWATVKYGTTDKNDICQGKSCRFSYPCSSSTSCSYYSLTLQKGIYQIDVFGAQGGGYNGNGGKGGLSSGIMRIFEAKIYFVFVGAQGLTETNGVPNATFGGGGSGYSYCDNQHVSSGGGASDIRTSVHDLESRIIVAGGGGGGGKHDFGYNNIGGSGSGNNGQDGQGKGISGSGAFVDKTGLNGNVGKLGFGGNSTQATSKDGCGGGGGYYGGNAGVSNAASGGGGSGFVKKSFFKYIQTETGVRTGHGYISITRISLKNTGCARNYQRTSFIMTLLAITLSSK